MSACKHDKFDINIHDYCPSCGETDPVLIRAERAEARLAEVTKERDELYAKYQRANKDYGCELRDPCGTIWDHAKKVEEERDALKQELAAAKAEAEYDQRNAAMSQAEAEKLLDELDILKLRLWFNDLRTHVFNKLTGEHVENMEQLVEYVSNLKDESAELNRLFDLQHKRCMQATRMWQEAHGESELVHPDLGRLIEWLIKRGNEKKDG